MKKYYMLISILLIGKLLSAQTSTLINLVDSLPGNGFGIIESFQNKLYSYPSFNGGPLVEIDKNTGALTPVMNIPLLNSPWEYTTSSGNFILLNGKTVLAFHNPAGPGAYVIAASPSGVDTLLRNITPFGNITSVDTMAYLLFSDSAGVGAKLYSTNLMTPALLIDSQISARTKSTTNELFYIKSNYPLVYDQQLYRTNGFTKMMVDNTTGSNNQIALLGVLNGDMYYTVCHRSAGMDTTWIKKCNGLGTVTVVDTILMNASSIDHGLVGLGSRLIIPFKNEAAPYYQDIIVYDLSTNTKINISQNSYYIRSYDMEQTQVAANHFYFNTISPIQRYISDGTVAGTKPYGTQAAGYGTDLEFENYTSYTTLGNKAALCDEYPNAGMTDEFYFGTDTGIVMYKLFQNGKSYPSHFNKIGNSTFFRIHDAAYTKMTVMKMTDCGMPLSNPLQLNDINLQQPGISPNPSADGSFTIQFATEVTDAHCRVLNCFGQEIKFQRQQTDKKTMHIQLPPSAKGIYYLQITHQTGIHTAKLLVQ